MVVYIKIGLFFLLKKITVFGKENIPKKGALLFIGNHQNALIDAILIPTTNNRNIHFLTRASAFKNAFANKLLRSLNMIPVYRIRDGVNRVEKNLEIFAQCFEFLKNEKAIEIFAEGEHHLKRKIIPLKKGFARIVLGTLQKYPNLDIQIIPVGINYNSHLHFPGSVSIYYGKPICANNFITIKNPDLKFTELLNQVSTALKKVTLHIEDTKNYDTIIEKLNESGIDFLNPIEATKYVENINTLPKKTDTQQFKINWFAPFHYLAKANSIFPLLIWKYLKLKIKEAIFYNTFRFALITTLFPLFYIIQSVIVYYFFSLKYALIYLVSCIVLGIITTKTTSVTLY